MKKLTFFLVVLATTMSFLIVPLASAAPVVLPFGHDTPGINHLPDLTPDTSAEAVTAARTAGTTLGILGFQKLVRTVGGFLSLVLGSIAIFALFIAGYQLISAQSAASEEISKQKMNVVYVIVGLVIFGLSGRVVYDFLLKSSTVIDANGNLIASGPGSYLVDRDAAIAFATSASGYIERIISLFLNFSGAVAILILVISGIRLVINPGDEDKIANEKKLVGYTAIGIIIINLAHTLITTIIFPEAGYRGVNLSAFEVQLQGLSNYILGFLGVGIFATLVISGVMMVANQGNEEVVGKIKSTLVNILIGSTVVFSAYTIVATLIRTFLSVPPT